MIGTTVGSYRITAKLGAGGMGEVYRATDTRLGREVAIKFSTERFSERFEREAQAVAALNHPNICTLYDVGPNYLVMELVEGPTLAEHLIDVGRVLSDPPRGAAGSTGPGLPVEEAWRSPGSTGMGSIRSWAARFIPGASTRRRIIARNRGFIFPSPIGSVSVRRPRARAPSGPPETCSS